MKIRQRKLLLPLLSLVITGGILFSAGESFAQSYAGVDTISYRAMVKFLSPKNRNDLPSQMRFFEAANSAGNEYVGWRAPFNMTSSYTLIWPVNPPSSFPAILQALSADSTAWGTTGTGDITGVIAGVGLADGGLSGDVTLNVIYAATAGSADTLTLHDFITGSPSANTFIKWNGANWVAAAAGGSIIGREVDGSPSIAALSTLEFFQSTGLKFTDQGSNVGRVEIDTSAVFIQTKTENNTLYVPLSRMLTAGNGLVGGGDLAANRTLDIIGSDGLKAEADTLRAILTSTAGILIKAGVGTIDSLELKLDGSTLSKSTAGVKVSAIGSAEITNGAIVNEDINASAAIAMSKIASSNAGRLVITSGGTLAERAALTPSALAVGDASNGVASLALGAANRVVGMNSGATANEYKDVLGTSNRVTVTHAANSITLNAPQDLHTAALNQFARTLLDTLRLTNTGGIWQNSDTLRFLRKSDGLFQFKLDLSDVPATGDFMRVAAGRIVQFGTIADADVPNTITLDNVTQITTRVLSDMQGQVGDLQIADGAVDGGAGGEIADNSVTADDIATDAIGALELAANAADSGNVIPLGISAGDINDAAILNSKLASKAVTYAKIQDISATQRVLGRNSSGAGVTEEITVSQVLDWISSTRGTVLYRGASGWAALSPGTSGQVLHTQGAGADPIWDADDGAGGGAPSDVDYLVGTASGSLSAEIVVGTSPGGELGGTWASPTIDADAVLWNEIGDAGGDATIANGAHETDFTSSIDVAGEAVFTITNTDADAANANSILILAHNDGADADVTYLKMISDADGTPANDFIFDQVSFTSLLPVNVPAEAYDATGWNGDTGAPQKDAVRDKIESLALTNDDLSDNSINDLNDVTITTAAAAQLLVRNAGNAAFENVSLSGDGSISAAGALTITDDSHAHTTTTISGLDVSDDLNLVAGTNITLTGDQLDVDDAFVLNTGDAIIGNLDFNDGVTDSPQAIFTPATGTAWKFYTVDSDDDLAIESASSASTENIDIINPGAGTATLTVEGAIGASNFSGSSSGTNTGDQTITLTSHVTGSGTGSFATTIANSVVTAAMMANGDHGAFTYASNVATLDASSVSGGNAGIITDNTIIADDVAADAIGASELLESADFSITGSMTFDSDALHIFDTNASHDLIITPGSDLTVDRVLTITTGDAARTLTMTGDATISGTNTGDITFTGENYLSLSSQQITANAVNLSGTHVTGTLAAARFPALTGDVTTTAGSVATAIGADKVTEAMLKAVNAAVDEDIFTYEATTGDFEWHTLAELGIQPLEATLTDIADGTIDENLVNTANPWAVNEGGTGAATFTANGVLYGNTTSALQVTAQGGANTVLTANAGAPSFSGQPTLATGIITKGQNAVEVDPYGASAGNTGETRFLELAATGTNYVGWKAHDALAATTVYTMPRKGSATTGMVLHYATTGDSTYWDTDDGAGGGAPTDAQYLVLALNGSLSAERVATGTANEITLTDGGANGNLTFSLPTALTLSSKELQGGTIFIAEGASANAFEGTFAVTDFTADRTITFDDLTGTVTVLGNTTSGTGAILREGSPTITTPTIADFSNSQHNHQGASGGGSLIGSSFVEIQNTTDAASNQVLIIGSGNRATPADNDEGYISFRNDNDAGTQTEFARLSGIATDVTAATKDGAVTIDVMNANSLTEALRIESSAAGTLVVNVPNGTLQQGGTAVTLQSRTITVAGTTNEITSSTGAQDLSANRTWTLSLPATIDLGGKTSFEVPNAAAPTVDAVGEIAVDDNAWATGRGTLVIYDGTAETRAVNVLSSDTPTNGQVPKWNTGGTITWEDDGGGAGGYATIQEEGSGLTQRTTLNFIGSSFTATDNSGASKTELTADTDLDALASNSTNGLWTRTGSGTGSARTITGTSSEITVTNGDGVSGNPTLSLPDVYAVVDLHAGAFFAGAGDLTGAIFGADADNTNDFSIDYLEFSASADNYISVVVNMPPDWDASTAPKFKIVSYSTGSHASQTAAWDISCGYVRPGTDSWVAALGTAVEATQTYTAANTWQLSSAFAPTPAGTAAAGAQIKIRLFREGTDATNDTFTSTSRLVKLQMQYKKTVYGDTVSW